MSVYERNIKQVLKMDPGEREMLAEQLRTELKEFKERERMYNEKREELKDLEKKYRKKQDQILKQEGGVQEKIETNKLIIEHLLAEINEHKQRLDNQETDNEGLEDKITSQRNTITQREKEIDDLKAQIQDRANQGEDLRHCLDQLALQQKLLLEEQEQEEEELRNLKDIRDMREQEAKEYGERLRRAKNEHFSAKEKHEQLLRLKEQKEKESQELAIEIDRQKNLVRQAEERKGELLVEEKRLKDEIGKQMKELEKEKGNKLSEDEAIRRLNNHNSDMRKKLNDQNNEIERFDLERKDIAQNNDFRDQENAQMKDEIGALEGHLDILDSQNQALEHELESFIRADDEIKEKLRSKSPPKVRFQQAASPIPVKQQNKDLKGSFNPFKSQGPTGMSQSISTKYGMSGNNFTTPYSKNGPANPHLFSNLHSMHPSDFKGNDFDEDLLRSSQPGGGMSTQGKFNKENDFDDSRYKPQYNPVRDRSPNSPLRRDGGRIIKNGGVQGPNKVYLHPGNFGGGDMQPENDRVQSQWGGSQMKRQPSNPALNESRDYHPVRLQQTPQRPSQHGSTLQPKFKEDPQKGAYEILALSKNKYGNYSQQPQYIGNQTNQSYLDQSNVSRAQARNEASPPDHEVSKQTKKKRKWSPLRGLLRRTYQDDDLDSDKRILY